MTVAALHPAPPSGVPVQQRPASDSLACFGGAGLACSLGAQALAAASLLARVLWLVLAHSLPLESWPDFA